MAAEAVFEPGTWSWVAGGDEGDEGVGGEAMTGRDEKADESGESKLVSAFDSDADALVCHFTQDGGYQVAHSDAGADMPSPTVSSPRAIPRATRRGVWPYAWVGSNRSARDSTSPVIDEAYVDPLTEPRNGFLHGDVRFPSVRAAYECVKATEFCMRGLTGAEKNKLQALFAGCQTSIAAIRLANMDGYPRLSKVLSETADAHELDWDAWNFARLDLLRALMRERAEQDPRYRSILAEYGRKRTVLLYHHKGDTYWGCVRKDQPKDVAEDSVSPLAGCFHGKNVLGSMLMSIGREIAVAERARIAEAKRTRIEAARAREHDANLAREAAILRAARAGQLPAGVTRVVTSDEYAAMSKPQRTKLRARVRKGTALRLYLV